MASQVPLFHTPSCCQVLLMFWGQMEAAFSRIPSWPSLPWTPRACSGTPGWTPFLHSALLGDMVAQGMCPLTSDPAPSSWQSLLSHLPNFRHLWPLKDLTLTTNQVRGWTHELPQGRPEL